LKVSLEDIEFDDDVYPRRNISRKTVNGFVEALKGGANFPPVEVQEVKENGEKELLCLDGKHRVLAYGKFNEWAEDEESDAEPIREIEADTWRDELLDKEENLEDLRVRAVQKNIKHGKRLSEGDVEFQARRIAKERPVEELNGLGKTLAEEFGYHPSTISGMIGDVVRGRKASRDAQIYKLSLLGWTQREIGKKVGLTHPAVGNIVRNFSIKEIYHNFENGKSIEEVSEYYGLDDVLTWAIVLDGRSDEERFNLFGESEYQDTNPRIYNDWNFSKCDSRLGQEHPGRIPGQIALNVLYYYTDQNDLVVDPMAGGGSTIDACLIMGRRCRAYDIEPTRSDVIKNDIRDGIPIKDSKADLVFLDPPYWRLMRDEYSDESSSAGTVEEWKEFIGEVLVESDRIAKSGGHIALVIEPFFDEQETGKFQDLSLDCFSFSQELPLEQVQRISVPLNAQVKGPRDVEYAKKEKILLDLNRDLIVWRKE